MTAGFGRALRAHRRAARLTQAELGARVGYHHSLISKVEGGVRLPPPGLARAADVALGAGGGLLALVDDRPRGTLLSLLPGADPGVAVLPVRWPARLTARCPEHGTTGCAVPSAARARVLLARLGHEAGSDLVHVLTALLGECAAADDLATVEWALHRMAPAGSPVLLVLAAHFARVAGGLRAARGQDALGMAWLGQGLVWAAAADCPVTTADLLADAAVLTGVPA
ncbi:helix-turn-helix domain-containing protein [Actinokineospora bangkokensis]|uniref:HTH cro/C1-type domain-containing protein n=1 Tax=Actinokineospora bangkokensis TaxID=1193682 RepID=A0A1Q9LID4_9PSEU|nr:helix-turn-helix transcriptional regulator [Actinokineospora bangkokensis]OLR91754.1 hypothetical protein BJP25_24825 [Actinokineospora bangkokensis]